MLSTNDESVFFRLRNGDLSRILSAFQRAKATRYFFKKRAKKLFQKYRKLLLYNYLQRKYFLLYWLESKGKKSGLLVAAPQRKKSITKKKEGKAMSKKEKNSVSKTEKVNPELEAANQEFEATQAETTIALEAPQIVTIALDAPEAIPSQNPEKPQAEAAEKDFRAELVAKAQAARQAAKVGLIPQEQADALWKQAEEACKPTEESLEKAKAAKEKKDEAEKVLKAAQNAQKVGLVTEAVVKEKEAIAEAAKTAYTEAAKAAKGFSLGTGGGGLRFKGQMSGLDAALRILAESETPLNAGAITKVAIEQGLWAPEGQTPASTMSALLQAEIKKGEKARFTKVAAGLYTVRKAE